MASISCSIPCSLCKRVFKTSTSFRRHLMERHNETEGQIKFVDDDNTVVAIPSLLDESEIQTDGYKKWLASLTERMIEALHPALPGHWIKITDAAIPKENVHFFIYKLQERQGNGSLVPYSVKFVRHRQNPYKTRTMKISYRFYDINIISDVLSEGHIPLQTRASFSGNLPIESPAPMTMAERIKQAISAGRSGYESSLEKRDQPTSTSAILCKEKDGRATREIEVIWWPGLLTRSQCDKLEIRFNLLKIDI